MPPVLKHALLSGPSYRRGPRSPGAFLRMLGVAVFLPWLFSCALTSEEYVDGLAGYSVVRGRIVEVDALTAREKTRLSDGLALAAKEGRGRITMDFGKRKKTIALQPGSLLVFSREGDFLLSPLKFSSDHRAATQAALSAPRKRKAPRPNRRLIEYVLDTLKAFEESRFSEAEARTQELEELFPLEVSAYIYAEMLRARLEEVRNPGSLSSPSQPAASSEDPEAVKKTVAALKKRGLDLYSRGKLTEAVECWKKVLELVPSDEEAKRYLERAETVSRKL